MKIEDKAYFEMQPNLQGMKKVRDEIYALAQTHTRLSEKSTDSQKQNYEYRIAAGLSSFVSRAPYAAEIGMEFKGSAYWNKKAIQLAKEGAAYGVIADKLIAEALSIYNSHSKPVEDKAYFAENKNYEALKQALAQLNYDVSNVTKYDQENEMFLVNGVWYYYKTTPSGTYKVNSVRRSTYSKPVEDKAYFDRQGSKAKFANEEIAKRLSQFLKSNGFDEMAFTILQRSTDSNVLRKYIRFLKSKISPMNNNEREMILLKTLEKQLASRTGTKTKFANRGAFAEASSSPVLGSLLEKKVMPEGGWRAVETDGGALVIAFEDGDIAGNFARRAAENGYSATAPMAMAGRFWNVKVQNENNK